MNPQESNWQNKNVLVTGATGLLGPYLIKDLISKSANVFSLVRDLNPYSLFFVDGLDKKTTVITGNLLDINLIQRVINEFNINIVFHLGAQAIVKFANRSPISTFKSNIEGTWNLLESCRLSPWVEKIIIASSDKAYGSQEILPYTEKMPLQGKHPYDVSKSCADLIAQSYFHTYKLPICVTRCGNFFGGGDLHFNRIIPETIKSVLNDENPIVRSDGKFIRDYIYVKDVSDAYIKLAEKMDSENLAGECFNFSTDKPYSVIEIVDIILKLMDATHLKPIIQNNARNEIYEQSLCSEKAMELLSWNSKYGVCEGLKETINWYKNFFSKKSFYLRKQNLQTTQQQFS